jgi:hypothetical protein
MRLWDQRLTIRFLSKLCVAGARSFTIFLFDKSFHFAADAMDHVAGGEIRSPPAEGGPFALGVVHLDMMLEGDKPDDNCFGASQKIGGERMVRPGISFRRKNRPSAGAQAMMVHAIWQSH